MKSFELLVPPKRRFARIIAGTSSVTQRKPMASLPCVTSIVSVTKRGSDGAAGRSGALSSAGTPRGRAANASSSASSTRRRSALPQ